MAVVDGYMPTPREGVGRHVDASEITRPQPTTNPTDQKVNRQRVNVSDSEDPAAHANVRQLARSGDYGVVVRVPPDDTSAVAMATMIDLLQQVVDRLDQLIAK